MLRTSSPEGGLQQRTESPKATSGVPNGFVRPVAVASIFRPALGGSSGVSVFDGKPAAVPEKRRSSTAKENKVFGSSLSNEEFSRRRQSFDTKTDISLGQNVLKGDRSSPSRTFPDAEFVQERVDEVLASTDKSEENFVVTKQRNEIQNAVIGKQKDNRQTDTPAKSLVTSVKGNLSTEEKVKNTRNVPNIKSAKSDRTSLLESNQDVNKAKPSSESNVPAIPNGILDDGEVTAAIVKRPRSRNSDAADYVQKYETPQTERRRRSKFLLSTCDESVSSSSDSAKAEAPGKDAALSPQNEVTGVGKVSNETASRNQQPAVYPERRRRERTSQSASSEQNRNLKDTGVLEEDVKLKKVSESSCPAVSKDNSEGQTKSGLQDGVVEPNLNSSDEKNDSIEPLDNQPVSKFRTCRRTSDVIAAKIQTIFSKSDKPSTLPSSNKLSSSKEKSGSSVTEKETISEVLSRATPEQKISGEKSLERNEVISSKISSASPGDVSLSKKSESADVKKQQNVKCIEKVESSGSVENKSKQPTKTPSETGNSAVKSDTSRSSNEKFTVKSLGKDNKCNTDQKLNDSTSLTARSILSGTTTDNEKKCRKAEVFPRGAGSTVITKKDLSAAKESNSLTSKEEISAPSPTKKPLASINFVITEVSVESAPVALKITTGKVSPLQAISQTVEEKSHGTRKWEAKKSITDDSKVKTFAPKSEVNSGPVTSRFLDKSKTGTSSLLKEAEKVVPGNQQSKSDQTTTASVDTKTPSVEKVQGNKPLLLKEGKVQTENLRENNSQVQKSRAVENTSSETKSVKITKAEPVGSGRVTSKVLEKNKAVKTVLSKEEKVLSVTEEKTSQLQKRVTVESTSSESNTVTFVKTDIVNSGAQALKPSEKDKVGKAVLSKQESKLVTENFQEKNSRKWTAEKKVSFDTKAQSFTTDDSLNSSSPVAKTAQKDKLGKALPLKEGNTVTPETTLQKSSQAQKIGKTGTDVNTSSPSIARAVKPSEKDKTDSNLSLKEGNKVESENLGQKNKTQKSGAEGSISSETKAQNSSSSESAKSGAKILNKLPENDKLGRPLTQKEGNKESSESLQKKIDQVKRSVTEVNRSTDTKSQSTTTCESVKFGSQAQKLSEKDKIEKSSELKEGNKEILVNPQQKTDQVQKLVSDEITVGGTKGSEILNTGPAASKQLEKDKVGPALQHKENKVGSENLSKRSDIFLKWAAKESANTAVKPKSSSSSKNAVVASDLPSSKQSGTVANKTLAQKDENEMPSENVKQKSSSALKVNVDKPVPGDSKAEDTTSGHQAVDSSKININKEQTVEVKTKPVNSAEATQTSEQTKAKKNLKQELKPEEVAKYADVKKVTMAMKKTTSVKDSPQIEDTASAKSVQVNKRVETTHLALNSQSPTGKNNEKQESGEVVIKDTKHLFLQPQDSSGLKTGLIQKKLSVGKTSGELSIQRDTPENVVSSQVEGTKAADTILTNSATATEKASETKNSVCDGPYVVLHHSTKDLLASAKHEAKQQDPILTESPCFRSKTQEIYSGSRKSSSEMSDADKDLDDFGDLTNADLLLTMGNSSVFKNLEFPGRSFSYSKLDAPRPPERKRSGFLREMSTLTSTPPRVPLRSMSRTGSLKHPDDTRLPMDRTISVLRSASHSVLGPCYTPSQRISYTEMLSKLGTCTRNLPSTTTNRKLASSQVSELWADLSEEQSNSASTSELLESETSERMRLEKEVHELQSRYSQMQQKSDKMEMEMMEARVYRATEVNGDISEDEETDGTVSIYKQKYERAVRDMEIMKRRLQQQHEEEIDQSLMLKKAADKRLTEALEDVEEERQVVNQWKRKAQKLGAELQDLRLMLEEQMARNGELEKKQRRFDAELSAAQEEIRKEHQLREKFTRDKDQALLEKYSLEQELQATRLDMDMQHEKIALLNRELDELSLSSKGEEEVTQLKRAKQELERKTRDQEEELEELAGQVQMLEQAKLRLEMSLEKLRQEHRRESSVRDEEIEEIRASSSKKIKNLEAQLENEQEERHQLVKQKHELERRIIELSDQPPPQDPEIERRLRRDLKRTKALLRDAQSMLEHMRDGQANKTLIRQLKNQLEDAEFTKSVAIKARQTAELELQELQSQLEEVTRTKNDIESRCLQLSREKSALQTQLEEMEEEMAEVMKKYKAAVAQMSIDQKSLAEQCQQICELENEKLALKEQLAEVSTKLDHISVQTEDTGRVHRLDAKVRDLESKIELEQTTRSRLEHQIARLKEQCDRSREECDSLRNKELQAQEGTRRLQRQLRELREDYASLQQKESDAYRKQHELEMALENTEADLQVTKNDLRLACQRIQDLQSALEDDLDSGTDVPDESGSDTDSSLDVSVLGRQCLTPLQRSDSVSSNTSIGSESRQFRALSHSQDMAFFSRMMQTRTSMDFLI